MDIAVCVQWMAPFATSLREIGPIDLKFFQHIPHENTHNIQTHAVDMNVLVSLTTGKRVESLQTVTEHVSQYLGQVNRCSSNCVALLIF